MLGALLRVGTEGRTVTETLTPIHAALRYQQALNTFGGRSRDEIDRDITWDSPPEWQDAYRTIQVLEWLAEGQQ